MDIGIRTTDEGVACVPHEKWIQYGLGKPWTSLREPFGPGVRVLFVASKMFALFSVLRGRPYVNLKADPEEGHLLRMQYPNRIVQGYHMNKQHWITVFLDGGVPEEEIRNLMDASYGLVLGKLGRKARERLAQTGTAETAEDGRTDGG